MWTLISCLLCSHQGKVIFMVQSSAYTDNIIKDSEFDYGNVFKSVEIYCECTGMQVVVIDTNGKELFTYSPDGSVCAACKTITCKNSKNSICTNSHLYGSYQAERFGGKYVFFCPLGLVHWAAPVMQHGIMKCSLIGGPAQMVDPDEFMIEDIIKNNFINADIENLKQITRKVPVINPQKVDKLSEMLFIVASHAAGGQYYEHAEKREYHEQMSDISEYVHHLKNQFSHTDTARIYPIEKEKELITLITLGDKKGASKVLNEIFGHIFFSSGSSFDVVKTRVLELIVVLSRAALEGGADVESIFGLNYRYINQINNFKTVEELSFWLSKIMARFTDMVFNLSEVKHVDVIYRAVEFIKRNYMKKITLEDAASYVYLSPSYFSKIFKQEMKMSFNNYLNFVRVEMSKKLLLDEKIELVDISHLVGFEEQSYFCKVFKKYTGVTPGRYRESRAKLKK